VINCSRNVDIDCGGFFGYYRGPLNYSLATKRVLGPKTERHRYREKKQDELFAASELHRP